MLLKWRVRGAVDVFKMGNYCQPSIIQCSKLSANHHDQRISLMKWFKDLLKKSFNACLINHRRWSTIAENCDAWRLNTNHVAYVGGPLSRTKSAGEESQYHAINLYRCCNLTCQFLSVSNLPAVGVDRPLLTRFTKSSHDDVSLISKKSTLPQWGVRSWQENLVLPINILLSPIKCDTVNLEPCTAETSPPGQRVQG